MPFTNVAKKPCLEPLFLNMGEPMESFMDIARAIRHCTYAYMKVEPESCEVIPLGENKQLDKGVNTYLIHYKGMTRKSAFKRSQNLLSFFFSIVSFVVNQFYRKTAHFLRRKKQNTKFTCRTSANKNTLANRVDVGIWYWI